MTSGTRPVRACGERAVIIECADVDEALGLSRTLLARPMITEVVPGASTVLVRFAQIPAPAEIAALATAPVRAGGDQRRMSVEIEVDYDGPDLGEVAALLGISPAEVISRHTGQPWTVGFCGFAPGFGYLYGRDDNLCVPRRRTPRVRVPSGAVGLADRWSGVYPREGPGGWQLIGRTRAAMWDLDRDPPALLSPGTTVRFVPS